MVPLITGVTGDTVNELQLVKSLSKFARVYLFGFKKVGDKELHLITENENLKIFTLPVVNGIQTAFSIIASIGASLLSCILISMKRVDIIYCRGSLLAFGFTLFSQTAKRTIVKIVGTLEDEHISFIHKKFFSLISGITDKISIRRVGRIAVPSLLTSKLLFSKRQVASRNKPVVLPAGVDLPLIRRAKHLSEKGFLKHKKNIFRIGFVGTLFWWQGVDLLVQALSLVRKVESKAELYIVGEGPEMEKIEEMCKTYKLNYFITGYTSHEKALKLISTFDLLVVPSRRTVTTESNIPIKIIESWALGVPVIATYRTIFENYRAERDLLFCDRTPEDIAKKILHILKNESLKEKLSERGEHLVKNYSYDYIAKKLIQSKVP